MKLRTSFRVSTECCKWCKDDDRRIYAKRVGLCRCCYGVSRKLAKAKARWLKTGDSTDKFRYRAAKREMEIAQFVGEQYGDLDRRKIDGYQLEMEFRQLSSWLGKEMFFGSSNTFDWDFTLKQRRIIFEFLARMAREHFRSQRWIIASRTQALDEGWESLL